MFTANTALELYTRAFEQAGCLENLEVGGHNATVSLRQQAFTSINGATFYRLPLNESKGVLSMS